MPVTLGDGVHAGTLLPTHLGSAEKRVSVHASSVTFADGSSATTKGEEVLTFTNDVLNTVAGGSITRAEGSNTVVYTPVTPSPILSSATLVGNSYTLNAAQPGITEVGTLTALNVSGTTTTAQINSVYDYASDVVNGNQMSELYKFITAPHVKIGILLNSTGAALDYGNPHSGGLDGGETRVDIRSQRIKIEGSVNSYIATQYDHVFIAPAGKAMYFNYVNIHTAPSDDRIKFNETRVTDGLDVINQINIYTYDKVYEIGHTPQNDPHRREIGVIAQEIQRIPQLASCVSVNEVSEDSAERFPNGVPLSVYYDQIHSYHIRATQELHQSVQQQAQTIANLEARLSALESS